MSALLRSTPDTRETYYGLYTLDTFDIDDRLSLIAGGRLNVASISVGDRLGTAPELNSNQTYAHFNPVSGLTYKLTPGLTAYFGYSHRTGRRRRSNWPVPIPNRPCLSKALWYPIPR